MTKSTSVVEKERVGERSADVRGHEGPGRTTEPLRGDHRDYPRSFLPRLVPGCTLVAAV